jgi:hypothetical protein
LRKHPKLARLCNDLKITPFDAIGRLHVFWWWCIDYAPTGRLDKFDAPQLADAAEWKDAPEQFVQALVNANFLDDVDGVLSVHDWLDFCGELVKQRCRRLKEKRRTLRHVLPSKSRHPTQPTGPNQPNPTQPTNQLLTWFEQRFWPAYPRKKSKGQAKRILLAMKPTEPLQDRILDALERAKTSADWLREGGQYIPHPATWLRAEGWEDEHRAAGTSSDEQRKKFLEVTA